MTRITLTITMLPAVERLGCSRISRKATPGAASTGKMPLKKRRTRLPRAARARDTKSTTAYFANSLG